MVWLRLPQPHFVGIDSKDKNESICDAHCTKINSDLEARLLCKKISNDWMMMKRDKVILIPSKKDLKGTIQLYSLP